MPTPYQKILTEIQNHPKTWLVTGVAGFIGSNLLETLLNHDQQVVGLDNFSTGFRRNLDEVRDLVGPEKWLRFKFFEGDIRDLPTCRKACTGVNSTLFLLMRSPNMSTNCTRMFLPEVTGLAPSDFAISMYSVPGRIPMELMLR